MSNILSLGDARQLHTVAVEECVDGRFNNAYDYLSQSMGAYHEHKSTIDIGRGQRDFARVYSGLGDAMMRDAAIANSIDTFTELWGKTDEIAAEGAASYHVDARIRIARMIEDPDMATADARAMVVDDWRSAFRYATPVTPYGRDYLEQIVSHGAVGVAVNGRGIRDANLARRMYVYSQKHLELYGERKKAATIGGTIAVARVMTLGAPIQLPVRNKLNHKIAEPYIVGEAV